MDYKNRKRVTIEQTLLPDRKPTYFGERRRSSGESVRRQSLLDDRSKRSLLPTRNRARVLQEVRLPEGFNGVYSARIDPLGKQLALGFGAGAIQLRSPETGEIHSTIRSAMDQAFPIMCIRFHPFNTDYFYCSSASGNIYLCNSKLGEFQRWTTEVNNEVNALDFDVSGDILASGGKDATVRLYDVATAKAVFVFAKPSFDYVSHEREAFHRMRIFAVRFHPQHKDIIVTGGWDDTVKVWDTRIPTGCVRSIQGPHICGDAIDMKDKVILTASWVVSGSLQTWDLGSGTLIKTISPTNRPTTLDGEFLYCAQYFDGDPYGDTVVVGGSGTGHVEVISIKGQRVVGTVRAQKAVQALDSHDHVICFGGMESVLRVADYS